MITKLKEKITQQLFNFQRKKIVFFQLILVFLGVLLAQGALSNQNNDDKKQSQLSTEIKINVSGEKLSEPVHQMLVKTENILNTFKANLALYKDNPKKFNEDAESLIDPLVTFPVIARRVMGRYVHLANAKQITEFTEKLKHNLITLYGNTLLHIATKGVKLTNVKDVTAADLKAYKNGALDHLNFSADALSSKGSTAVAYSIIEVDNQWKLLNITVDGINLGIQLRNQFSDAMNQHGSIEKVIKHWDDVNHTQK